MLWLVALLLLELYVVVLVDVAVLVVAGVFVWS